MYEARNRITQVVRTNSARKLQREELLRLSGEIPRRRAQVLVVIPTYKRPDGLLRALSSALAQNFDGLAVAVVDDGGGLPDLPQDPRLTAVSLARNTATLGLVRNVGIALADSEFIAFLDDDNVWAPDHLATAVAALEQDPGLGAVYTSVRRIRPDGTELDVLGDPFDRKRLKNHSYIDANSIVVRRDADVGFSVLPRTKKTMPKEDWEYLWRLSRKHRLRHIPRVTVNYSVNPDSYYTTWDDQQL